MNSPEETTDLQKYILILKRRIIPASAVFVVTTSLVTIFAFIQKPSYQLEGKLLVKRESATSSLTGLGKELSELTPLSDTAFPLDTQTEILKSAPIIDRVIKDLEIPPDPMLYLQFFGNDLPINLPSFGQSDKNKLILRRIFLKKLKVEKSRGTDVLAITYNDTDPKRGVMIVNTIMNYYLEDNLRVNRLEAVAARLFIEDQLPQAEKKLRNTEAALRRFREDSQIVNSEQEAISAVNVDTDAQRQINKAEADLADTEAQLSSLQSKFNISSEQSILLANISDAPGVQRALQEFQQVESKLAIERNRFTDSNPIVVALSNDASRLKQILRDRIQQAAPTQNENIDNILQVGLLQQNLTQDLVRLEGKRTGLIRQLETLRQTRDTYRTKANIFPKLLQKQQELNQQLQAYQTTYTQLLQKLQEIRIAENQAIGNARIISEADIPDQPTSPWKLLYAIVGALLGVLLGVITAFVIETQDKSIWTIEETRRIFNCKLLCIIPHLDLPSSELILRYESQSPLWESYRMLRASLNYLGSIKENKIIVISSAVPNEGKSTVSANLAIAMAQTKQRVLLIDADLHNPHQHEIWSVSNDIGLSNILDSNTNVLSVIKVNTNSPDLLTSGSSTSNPSSLLDSPKLRATINELSNHYDFIIIDTPPLSVAADAIILGQLSDNILLIARPGIVDSLNAVFVKEMIDKSGQNIMGLVINGAHPKQDPQGKQYFNNTYYSNASLKNTSNNEATESPS
ncbi:GumC family protein [Pseudanabaena sp. ABRG5-3]|uniref:GumC family protein n=1 Tax=Pseudanabaena sp. ABRG5-3 TaxID=685565 RepID=UPI000DC731B0|nr:polysaccharide biosynthesis tyrosine autokinase [Pseudanabaena sp. ABRG5-3]BBC27194.1 lipopolysaccharide biosynthesis protein [Pseudanabaena sp. ABRG5-3]